MQQRTLSLSNNLVLAPMAGISYTPFRRLVKRFGCSLPSSEMISATGIYRHDRKTLDMLHQDLPDQLLSLQIFGADPVALGYSAAYIEANGGQLIDLNMGCPVKKVIKSGSGSALMRQPELCAKIFRAMTKATKLPITVKIRAGWDHHQINALEIGKIAQAEGITALTIHPRTRAMQFSGQADWRLIAELKANLSIPVIGNGDVFSVEDAARMHLETGCDGIMIGRGCLGNPWIFQNIRRYFLAIEQQETPPPASAVPLQERYDVVMDFIRDMAEFFGEHRANLELRKHLGWFSKGLAHATILRSEVFDCPTLADLIAKVKIFFETRLSEENRIEIPDGMALTPEL